MNVIRKMRTLQEDPRESALITNTAAMVEQALKPLTPVTERRLAALARDILRLVDPA